MRHGFLVTMFVLQLLAAAIADANFCNPVTGPTQGAAACSLLCHDGPATVSVSGLDALIDLDCSMQPIVNCEGTLGCSSFGSLDVDLFQVCSCNSNGILTLDAKCECQ